jgi:hypothetical protein
MSRRKKQQPKKQASTLPFRVSTSENYRYVTTSGVFGGMSPNDCHIIFYLDRYVPDTVPGGAPDEMRIREVNRELQVEIHMSPAQFMSMSQWMTSHVNDFQEQFGEIQILAEE